MTTEDYPESQPDAPEVQVPDMSRRNAFGRVALAEYFGIDPETIPAQEEVDETLADPDYLEGFIHGHWKNGNFIRGVLFAPSEWDAMPRSVRTLTNTVANKTRGARFYETDLDVTAAAAERSKGHVAKSKLSKVAGLITTLTTEHTALQKLHKEVKAPGYAHMDESQMRVLVATARVAFHTTLSAVAHSESWSQQDLDDHLNAQRYRLLGAPYHTRIGNWRSSLFFQARYTNKKRLIAHQAKNELDRMIEKTLPDKG